jgi:exonuclease III
VNDVRVLAWNLLHGGGKRVPALAEAIAVHEPDLVVLAESRSGPDQRLIDLLAPRGLVHHAQTTAPAGKNGVLVLSRTPLASRVVPAGPMYAQRWLELDLAEHGFSVLACHVPPKISIGVHQKRAFWHTLLEHAEQRIDEPALIIGDLNTGAPFVDEHRATLYCAEEFQRLEQLGWTDAWRRFHGKTTKEWTWVYPRRRSYGYRLDHAFCSPGLVPRLLDCRYSHEEREARLSDHSILLVDIADRNDHRSASTSVALTPP